MQRRIPAKRNVIDKKRGRKINGPSRPLDLEIVAKIMTERGYPMNKSTCWYHEHKALEKLREGLQEFVEEHELI